MMVLERAKCFVKRFRNAAVLMTKSQSNSILIEFKEHDLKEIEFMLNDYVTILDSLFSDGKLTDKEQRIFLSAMRREHRLCKQIDNDFKSNQPYNNTLSYVCLQIEKKVKKILF